MSSSPTYQAAPQHDLAAYLAHHRAITLPGTKLIAPAALAAFTRHTRAAIAASPTRKEARSFLKKRTKFEKKNQKTSTGKFHTTPCIPLFSSLYVLSMPTAPTPSFAPLQHAMACLITFARAFFASPAPKTRRPADPARAAARMERTLAWLAALAHALAGEMPYRLPVLRFPGRFPSLTADLRAEIGLPALPKPTQAQREAAQYRYMRRVLETVATGRIATRLARRLNLAPTDPAWPHSLAAITEPATVWGRRNRYPGAYKRPAVGPPPDRQPPAPLATPKPPDPPPDTG